MAVQNAENGVVGGNQGKNVKKTNNGNAIIR